MTKYSNLLCFKILFLSFIFTSLYNHCHSCIFLDTIRTKIILCFLHCIEEFSWLCIRKNPKRSGLTTELCTKKQMVTEMCRCLIFKWFSIPVCATVYTSDPWQLSGINMCRFGFLILEGGLQWCSVHLQICFLYFMHLNKCVFKQIDVHTNVVCFQGFQICINGFFLILFLLQLSKLRGKCIECTLSAQNTHTFANRVTFSLTLTYPETRIMLEGSDLLGLWVSNSYSLYSY